MSEGDKTKHGELQLQIVPPPDAAPNFPLSAEYGVPAFFDTVESIRQYRCGGCNTMQQAGTPQVWVPDGLRKSDPKWAWEEASRENAYNGNFTAWCLDCARSVGGTAANERDPTDISGTDARLPLAIGALAIALFLGIILAT